MPTYQYKCSACDHAFEKYQSFSDDPIRVCPECGKEEVSKLISGGAGLVFKGGGFYETDYNRGNGSDYKKKADADSGKTACAKDAPCGGNPKACPAESNQAS